MADVGALHRRLEQAVQQRQAAEELASQQRRENDALRSQVQSLRASLEERSNQTVELESRLNQLETERTTERVELHRLKQEVILVKEFSEKSKKDYEKRLEESAEEWKACMKRLKERDAALSKAQLEKNAAEAAQKAATLEIGRLNTLLEQAAESQARIKADLLECERARDEEMASCKNLLSHCKFVQEEANREKDRAAELVSESVHRLEQAMKDFEREKAKLEAEYREKLSEFTAKKLDLDISHAVVATVSPSVAEEMLRNRGFTLTSLYAELVDEREKTHQLQEENSRLNDYLQKISDEVQQSAPELVSARLEYNRVLANCDVLNEKLAEMFTSNTEMRQELEATKEENEKLRKENKELELQAEDLSSQLRKLLSVNDHEVSFSSPPRTGPYSRGGDSVQADAQSAISENLVQYSNVSELQERNQQLLRLVRRLAEESEKNGDVSEAEARLQEAEAELERMAEARKRQEQMIEAIVKQRDLYRALLHQADQKFSNDQELQLTTTTTTTALSSGANEQNASVAALSEDFAVYRQEMESQVSELRANVQASQNELRETKFRLSQVDVERAALQERAKMLSESLDVARKDVERMRDAESRATHQVIQAQNLLEERRQELDKAHQQQRVLEQELALARAEIKTVREQVEQQQETIRSLTDQRNSQRVLADQWKKAVEDTTKRYDELVAERERSGLALVEMRAEVARLQKEREAAVAQAERERAAANDKLESAVREAQQARESFVRAEKELEVMRRTEVVLKEQLERALLSERSGAGPSGSSAGGGATTTTSPSPGFRVVEDLRMEIGRLMRDVEQRTKDVEALKAQLSSMGQSLETARTAAETAKTNFENQLKAANEENAKQAARIAELEQSLRAERARATESENKLKELNLQISELESMRNRLAQANEDVQRFRNEAQIAAANYNRELQLHAADVAGVTETRRELDRVKSELHSRTIKVEELESTLTLRTKQFASEKKVLEERLEASERELNDLRRETRLLVDQLSRTRLQGTEESGESGDIATLKETLAIATSSRDKLALEKEELSLQFYRIESERNRFKTELERSRQEIRRLEQQVAGNEDRQKLAAMIQENKITKEMNIQLSERLKSTSDELEKLRARLSSLEETAMTASAKIKEAQDARQIAENTVAKVQHELKLKENRLADLLNRLKDANLVDNLKKQVEEKSTQIEELKKQLDTKTREIETANMQVKQIRGAHERQTASSRAKVTQLESEVTELKTKLEEAQSELARAQASGAASQGELRANIERLEGELKEAQQKVTSLEDLAQRREEVMTRFREQVNKQRLKISELEQRNPELVPQQQATTQTTTTTTTSAAPVEAVVMTPPVEESKVQSSAAAAEEESISQSTQVPAPQTAEEPEVVVVANPGPVTETASSAAETAPPSEPENLDRLDILTLKKVLQKLKMPFSNMSKDDLLERLKQFAATNEAEVRKALALVRPTGPPQPAHEQAPATATVSGQTQTTKPAPRQQPTSVFGETAASAAPGSGVKKPGNKEKRKQELQQKMEALQKAKSRQEAIEPVTLPPAPADSAPSQVAAAGAHAPGVDEEEQKRLARLARFGPHATSSGGTEPKKRARLSVSEELASGQHQSGAQPDSQGQQGEIATHSTSDSKEEQKDVEPSEG